MKNSRVLVVDVSTLLAGSQKVTLSVVEALDQNEFDIFVYLKEERSLFDGFYDKFKVKRFFLKKQIAKYFGTGDFSLSKMSVFDKLKLIFTIFVSNIEVLIYAKKNKISLVYCYDPKGLILCGLFLKFFNIEVIWHLHGKLTFPEKLNRWLVSLPSVVVVPSCSVQESIIKYRTDAKVIYNGFDFKNTVRSVTLSKNTRSLTFVGTIVPNKGLHLILENLIESSIDDRLVLRVLGEPVGLIGEKYYKYILSLLPKLPENIEVSFEGWVEQPEKYIKNSDLLIFSSVDSCTLALDGQVRDYKASEALPTVLIESIGLGVPVLASRTFGVSEIVSESKYGIILDDITDKQQFLCALKTALELEHFSVSKRFLQKFSKSTMRKSMVNLVKERL